MRGSVALILTISAIVLCACTQDFAGLTELDRMSAELARQGQVADVICPDTMLVATSDQCSALNTERTRLEFGGVPLVSGGWESRGPQIVSVSLDGRVYAESPGVIWILARGSLESVDSARIVVPAP